MQRTVTCKEFNKYKLTTLAYFPFGAGPRACVGRRLALIEIKLAAVRLLQNFRIMATSKTTEPRLTGNFILLPDSVNVKLEELN
jgi:cytochrome P450